MDQYMATVLLFAGKFAPKGWAFCDGKLLSISQYSALFSLLGTTYGGDGVSTFALPDLKGRAPVHPGQGEGLSPYALGEKAGAESFTLMPQQLPSHSHALHAVTTTSNQSDPLNNYLSVPADGSTGASINTYNDGTDPVFALAALSPKSVSYTGDNQPVKTTPPCTWDKLYYMYSRAISSSARLVNYISSPLATNVQRGAVIFKIQLRCKGT